MKSPSIRQKLVAEKMVANGGSMKKAMKEAGYSDAYAKNPQKLVETDTWDQLLDKVLSDDKLATVADEGLGAMKIVSAKIVGATANENTDDFIEVPDFPTRQKYLETALKMRGKIIAKTDLTTKGEKITTFTVATKEAKESLEQLYAGSNSTNDEGVPR